MKKFVPSKIEELNLPHFCRTLNAITDGDVYIYSDTDDKETFSAVVPGIYVPGSITDLFDVNYFNTAITGKRVFVPLHLYGGYLPVSRQTPFRVCDADETVAEYNGYRYKEVEFTTEGTLADLYKNAAYYQYSADTDTFIRLPESGMLQNKLKLVMQKNIMEIGGDAYDRIADLSRVVLFLLSKVTLSEDEQTLLAPLLAHSHTANELADVFHRERLIQDYVAEVKADPEAYINAGTNAAVDTDTNES